MLVDCSRNLKIKHHLVEKVHAGYVRPIRNHDINELLDGQNGLAAYLQKVAQSYQATEEQPAHVWLECLETVFSHYSHLGIEELKLAFQLKEAGYFEAPGGEAYGGFFSAGTLAKVLRAYNQWRNKVIAGLHNAYYIQQAEAKKAEIIEQRKAKFDEKFPELIKAFAVQEKEVDGKKSWRRSWQDVPVFWYDVAKRKGMLNLDRETALEIFEDAKGIAAMEQPDEIPTLDRHSPEQDRAKTIARKLSVFRLLVLPIRAKHKKQP